MSSLIKNTFFLVTFIAILWFGYRIFFTEDAALIVEEESNQALLAQNDFLAQLRELRDLRLDAAIFEDPEFRSLTDRRVDVIDEDAGRPNPFAPVPGLDLSPESNTQ